MVHTTEYKNVSQTQRIPLLTAHQSHPHDVPTDIQNSPLARAQHTQVPPVDKACVELLICDQGKDKRLEGSQIRLPYLTLLATSQTQIPGYNVHRCLLADNLICTLRRQL